MVCFLLRVGLLLLGTALGVAKALEDEESNFAIRMRIRKGGKVRKGGQCDLRERDLILQAMTETVGAYHNALTPTEDAPWWCHRLCQHYQEDYCTIFHGDCPHPSDLMASSPSETERRQLGESRLVEIFDSVDRHAHPSSPEKRRRQQKQTLKTKCHAAKVSVLTRLRDELGHGVSKSCISFLKFRMDLSCFLVNQPSGEGSPLTDGTFEDELNQN